MKSSPSQEAETWHEHYCQYWLVRREKGARVIAMFQFEQWAVDWADKHCPTGIIEPRDFVVKTIS